MTLNVLFPVFSAGRMEPNISRKRSFAFSDGVFPPEKLFSSMPRIYNQTVQSDHGVTSGNSYKRQKLRFYHTF